MGFSFLDQFDDPPDRLVEDSCLERIDDELAASRGRDQARLPEQVEVIGDARFPHVECVRDLARAQVAFLEHLEDAASGRVLKRLEEEVHRMVR